VHGAARVAGAAGDIAALESLNRLCAFRPGADEVNAALLAAAGSGHAQVLRWVLDHKDWGLMPGLDVEAVEGGHWSILRFLFEDLHAAFPRDYTGALCRIAARKGDLPMLRYLQAHGCEPGSSCFVAAASGGHIPVMAWLRESLDLRWHLMTCLVAANAGQLEMLQWLRAQTPPCPWGSQVISTAMKRGFPEVAAWAVAQGCPS
jgi:hypothetical protein